MTKKVNLKVGQLLTAKKSHEWYTDFQITKGKDYKVLEIDGGYFYFRGDGGVEDGITISSQLDIFFRIKDPNSKGIDYLKINADIAGASR